MADRRPIVAFLKLEREQTKKLEEILQATMYEMNESIYKAAGSKGVGGQVTALQLRAQQSAIHAYMLKGFDDVGAVVKDGREAAARAASDVISQAQKSLLSKLGLSTEELQLLATSEANRAANGVVAAMRRLDSSYRPLSAQVYRSGMIANGQIDKIINQALVRGDTWQELAANVKNSIDPRTPGGAAYAAKRLARTEINNAFHAASVARFKEQMFVDEVDWNLSSSHPEGDQCDTLKAESPYPVDEVPEKPHPHCFCYITAALPDPDQFMKNLFDGKYDHPGEFDDETPTNEFVKEAAAAKKAEPVGPTDAQKQKVKDAKAKWVADMDKYGDSSAKAEKSRAAYQKLRSEVYPPAASPVTPATAPPATPAAKALYNRKTIDGYKEAEFRDLPRPAYTQAELDAANTYVSSGYEAMNSALRGGKYEPGMSPLTKAQATARNKTLEAAIRRGSTTEDMVVYRGQAWRGLGPLEPGSTYRSDSFLSTAAKTVDGSELDNAFKFNDVQMQIMVPKGSKGAAVGAGEGEFLMPPGSTFKVIEVERREVMEGPAKGRTLTFVKMVLTGQ